MKGRSGHAGAALPFRGQLEKKKKDAQRQNAVSDTQGNGLCAAHARCSMRGAGRAGASAALA